jgi:two-component sensor histidine kinase
VIKHLTKPIRSLVIGASIIGKGELTHKIEVVSSDELGELAQSFNKMAGALRENKEHLEERIQERTADLNRVGKQLKSSLQEKEVLLREIYHRVKSNLQVISSLLSLQAKAIEDEEMLGIFLESQGRINSMALIHEKLYGSKDLARINFADYVPELVQNLYVSYGADADRVKREITVAEGYLGIDTAIPLGLIINELVSNSLKHAFPVAVVRGEHGGGQECEIRVDLHRAGDGTYLLTVSDNGVGFPKDLDFHDSKTLGLELVNMLANQLDGIIELEGGIGSQIKIRFAELQYRGRGLR